MPQPKEKITHAAVLAKAPLFAELTEAELTFLAQRAVFRRFAAGELIFSEGESCPGLYVIESGFVKIFKASASGREQVLTIDGPGQAIAELPVFDGGAYPASAQAVQDSVLVFISKQDFQSLCVSYPKVALKVLRVLGLRLRNLVSIIEELSFTTVRSRLASLLVRFARTGKKTPAGIEINLAMSNQELAAQIGTVRELISRNLGRLQAAGLVQLEGRTVVIPNLERLEQEIETAD
jgi:CRP/FNR family transcriptional regulator